MGAVEYRTLNDTQLQHPKYPIETEYTLLCAYLCACNAEVNDISASKIKIKGHDAYLHTSLLATITALARLCMTSSESHDHIRALSVSLSIGE